MGDETWNSIYGKKKKKEETSTLPETASPYKVALNSDKMLKGKIYSEIKPEATKKNRDNIYEKSPFDVWKEIKNPLANNKKDDGESFHERVRKNWESRTLPERTVNSRSLRAPENAFLQAPPRMPERYISKTEQPKKAELFTNDFAPDYSAFRESDFPDYQLMSNSAGGKNTLPESDNEWDAAETKVETEAVEGGVIRPGYNQRGHWSQDPDADNYGKDSPKYLVISKLDTMYETANEQNRENIISFADDFRSFDENSICRVYYLNDKDGAKNFGHTGVLLVNNKGQGLLFSYGAATGNFVYGDARMNVGVYTPNDVWNILKGREIVVLSTKGFNTYEQYERWVYYDVSAEDGKKMFDTAGKAMFDLDKYAILWNNCDQVVNEIFDAGGEHVTSAIWPNLTYEKEYFQYNVKETYQDIKKISLKLYNKLKNIWE